MPVRLIQSLPRPEWQTVVNPLLGLPRTLGGWAVQGFTTVHKSMRREAPRVVEPVDEPIQSLATFR